MASPFITGFAQGFSESVSAAIEKEQKSMDDLFKTQFEVRLKRRLDDLEKDRDNLSETSKHLEAYAGYTGGNYYQAAQLYNAAGGQHSTFQTTLQNLRNSGKNPYNMYTFVERENSDVPYTLDQISRALVTTPTALPFHDMPQQQGGLLG